MKANILVVDKSELIGARLVCLVEGVQGIGAVSLVYTLEEALEYIRLQMPSSIVLNLHFPTGLGLEIIGQIRQQAPRVPVIVLTNSYGARLQKKCLELGADHFCDNAADLDEMMEVIARQVDLLRAAP